MDWIERDSVAGELPPSRLEAFRYLRKNWDAIRQQYPGEFVAATSTGIRAHGPDWVLLYQRLKAEGVQWDDVAMRYCPDPEALAEILGCS
ncbi:MAG: hypothetical protein WED87_08175 [Dehalococcoidia bacterium]